MNQAGVSFNGGSVDKLTLSQDRIHSTSKALKIANLPQSICNENDAVKVKLFNFILT